MSDARSHQKAERLAAALKENLRRRKAQARGRKAASASSDKPAPPDPTERDKASD